MAMKLLWTCLVMDVWSGICGFKFTGKTPIELNDANGDYTRIFAISCGIQMSAFDIRHGIRSALSTALDDVAKHAWRG